jgi:hypothetical protein
MKGRRLIRSLKFAPNGVNPCDILQLKLRLLPTAEQHRTDCHESGAVNELTLLPPCAGAVCQNVARVCALVR